jgi:hypothetical protein
VTQIVLHIDPEREPARARQTLDSHPKHLIRAGDPMRSITLYKPIS